MKGTVLRKTSLVATLALTSHAEIAAGIAAGWQMYHPFGADGLAVGLPMLLPVAVDCYVVDALEHRRGGDRWAALGILALSVIGGSAYVAVTLQQGIKAAGVGVILVLVLARLYAPVRPSKAEAAEKATADAERRAEDAARRVEETRRADADRVREEEASRLRIEEAEHLASIDARRVQAEADAEMAKARAAAEAARTLADAEVARVQAESAAEVARIHAEAEAARPQRPAKGPASRPRTTPGKAYTPASVDAPSKDDAARMVASAIREHEGPEPYVFEWRKWSEKHGGGRSFWFAARAAAEQGPHLAKAAG